MGHAPHCRRTHWRMRRPAGAVPAPLLGGRLVTARLPAALPGRPCDRHYAARSDRPQRSPLQLPCCMPARTTAADGTSAQGARIPAPSRRGALLPRRGALPPHHGAQYGLRMTTCGQRWLLQPSWRAATAQRPRHHTRQRSVPAPRGHPLARGRCTRPAIWNLGRLPATHNGRAHARHAYSTATAPLHCSRDTHHLNSGGGSPAVPPRGHRRGDRHIRRPHAHPLRMPGRQRQPAPPMAHPSGPPGRAGAAHARPRPHTCARRSCGAAPQRASN